MKKTIIFGTGQENEKSKFKEKKFIDIIQFCIEKNILTFDTSDNYLNGKIEKILGKIFLSSKKKIKIINKFRLYNDINILRKNLEKSLKNLNRDFIDLYMPHWPTHDYDKQMLSDFANECIQKKKIKEFGLSNFSLKMIKNFKKIYKKKISLQFELNISNYNFYEDLINYINKNKINSYCYSINKNFPESNQFIKIIQEKYNLNNYETSIRWISNLKNINPIIRSTNKKNIIKNINLYNIKKNNIKFKKKYLKKNEITVKYKDIKKIKSESGYIYTNIAEAKKNKFNLHPSPVDISNEIKKFGLLKPFYFKRYNTKYFSLISGQARFWAYRLINKRSKKIKGLLIE
tara:strand:+ start:161 stop:1198 length:1038 start_codon:yes stop_codon:yes gene_type:complete